MDTPPKCVQCDKELKRYRRWVHFEELTRAQTFMRTVERPKLHKLPIGCLPCTWAVTHGLWGYQGDGSFCSLRCGYEWAVNQQGS